MKYYIIAGEMSGDLHGANLIRALLKQDPKAHFRCWGGEEMEAAGGHIIKHYKTLAFMGFLEVLLHIRIILRNIHFCKNDIQKYKPDVLVFIDYPGFNLRIAKWAKKQGYKTHYYISPQLWAWKENRIHNIKRDIDFMYVILPFEKNFYEQKHQYPVHFVGHPLLDAMARKKYDFKVFKKKNDLDSRPIIALLPGSRKQEIQKVLGHMILVSKDFPEYQFIVAGAESCDKKVYSVFQKDTSAKLVFGQTYDLLNASIGALVTSGTATLEAALFKVPEVVCYRGGRVSYFIAKKVMTLKFISLVNLIMNKEVVKELIQEQMSVHNLKEELSKILKKSHRERILKNYVDLEALLGGSGASENTAKLIIKHSTGK